MKKPNGLVNITNNLINRQLFTAPIQQLNNQLFNTRYELLTLQRHLLSEKYSTDGIYKTLVDQPVLDAFRGELKIESKTISSDELEELNNYLYNHNILNTIKQLFIWNRLFAGSALIIETINQNLEGKLIGYKVGDSNISNGILLMYNILTNNGKLDIIKDKDKIVNIDYLCTDGHHAYDVISNHILFKDYIKHHIISKKETCLVESFNSYLRDNLTRLKRKRGPNGRPSSLLEWDALCP